MLKQEYFSPVDVAGITVMPPISASPNTNTQLLSDGLPVGLIQKTNQYHGILRQHCTQPMNRIPEHSDFP
jgi:hypothetical protein